MQIERMSANGDQDMTARERFEALNDLVRPVGVQNLPQADKDFFYAEGVRLLKEMAEED